MQWVEGTGFGEQEQGHCWPEPSLNSPGRTRVDVLSGEGACSKKVPLAHLKPHTRVCQLLLLPHPNRWMLQLS